MRRSVHALLASSLILAMGASGACAKAKPTPTPAPTPMRTFYFKALSGISMGAMGAGMLAAYGNDHTNYDGQQQGLDAVAPLGGPLDVAFFLGGFERMQMGGWCPYAQLSAMGDADVANGTNLMNDPTQLNCPMSQPFLFEHQQSYDHWQFTDDGGDFDRTAYPWLFYDLSLALGNPLYYNPESPTFPAPGVTQQTFNQADICTNPVVFPGVGKPNANPIYNAEFNPAGTYNVITVCDGQAPIWYCNDVNSTHVDFCMASSMGMAPNDPNYPQQFCNSIGASSYTSASNDSTNNYINPSANLYYQYKGVFDPCYPSSQPVSFGLAVDYNGNGKRDYFEPVLINGHERFSDVGTDGCADAYEDGHGGCSTSPTNLGADPNKDNFDPVTNPLGTENDWKWEKGEPFEDNGLDGVPNTHDYGEGNGVYDDGPNRQNWFKYDFRSNYLSWSAQEQATFNVYADGGYRDIFNFGLSADIMTSAVHSARSQFFAQVLDFTDFPYLPGDSWTSMGGFYAPDINFAAVPPNVYVRYGDVDATVSEIREGDGDHVGTPAQVADRLETWVSWTSNLWAPIVRQQYPQDFDHYGNPLPISTPGEVDVVNDFQSTALGALRNFDIALPPGYNDPANAQKRYPVVTLGHGYGMDPDGMAGFSAVTTAFMQAGSVIPMIIIFPSGKCCFEGPVGRECREYDDSGNYFDNNSAYVSECHTGTFYVNSQDSTSGGPIAYGDSMFEILDYVDKTYRTMAPVQVPAAEYP